jgi:hypothetical protein
VWVAYRKVAGPRVQIRVAPVVLESVAGGALRYSREESLAAA